MSYWFYTNVDGVTQVFAGTIIIVGILIVIGANVYYWLSDKIKQYKQKRDGKN